jgi:hypothetical protein
MPEAGRDWLAETPATANWLGPYGSESPMEQQVEPHGLRGINFNSCVNRYLSTDLFQSGLKALAVRDIMRRALRHRRHLLRR